MGKQIFGIIIFLAGAALTYSFWHDLIPSQYLIGVIFRISGILVSALGFLLFFEGLKKDIIEAIKETKETPKNRD